MTTTAITGHRPPKLGLTYGAKALADHELTNRFRRLFVDHEVSLVITGMALGADLLAARAAYLEGIPFHAYLPFSTQDSRWPAPSRERWRRAVDLAAEVVIVSDKPSPQAFLDRNKAMVDAADILIAAWDGSRGGTYHAVQYAKKVGLPTYNTESLEVTS